MKFALYRSSAGSGKTYTLVKEYLKIVLEHPEKFKHVLAVTFTNKAAGEMKERIMQALKKLAKNEEPILKKTLEEELPKLEGIDKISAELLTNLLHNYSDFAIMTIDSFIHKVLIAFALEVGLPLNFNIDLNYERIQTYVIEKLMASVGKDMDITENIMALVFSRMNQDKSWNIENDVRKFETELFNEKNFNWVKKIEAFDNTEFHVYIEQLKHLRKSYIAKLNGLGRQGLDLIRSTGLTIDSFAYKKSGAAGFLKKCAELKSGGESKLDIGTRFREGQWMTKSTDGATRTAIETLLHNGLEQVHVAIIDNIDTHRATVLTAAAILENVYLTAIINRLKLLIDEYKKKNNVVPIAEFNTKVNEIVTNSPVPFIYSILGEKYGHYLIDEFQDTSMMQWENLFPLIDNALATNSFNMAVGDGKQSIYRWRGGDVEIMEKDVLEKIHPEQLSVRRLGNNFRSRQAVVNFNNDFFQKVSVFYKEEHALLETIYSEIAQEPAGEAGGFVSLRFIDDTVEGEDPDDRVFDEIYPIIQHHLANGGSPGDIAVLVRQNKNGRIVAEKLLEKDIPVVSPDSLILSKIPMIRFLLDLLTYLDNPTDDIAAVSIAYFLGLNKKDDPLDATTIGSAYKAREQWNLTPELTEFFQRKKYLIRLPVYEVMEEVIRIFKLDESLDFETLGFLQAFLDIVARYTAENGVDISSFLDWWEFSGDDFYLTAPEDKPAVKIMSIHKAKGLEFPIVIIPYANWEHKADPQLWLRSDPPLPVTGAEDIPMPVRSRNSLEETFFAKEFREEKEKVLIDNINLMYVAFTRAVDELHIVARRKKANENYQLLEEQAAPLMREDDEREGRYVYGTRVEIKDTAMETRESDYEPADQLISREWSHKLSIRRRALEFMRFDLGYREDRQNWGILVHKVLAAIGSPDEVNEVLDRALAAGEIDPAEKRTLEKKLPGVFEMEAVKDWFDPRHTVFAEATIFAPGEVLRPDRVVVADDRVMVIDYKTGGESPGHAGQVRRYMTALGDMGYENIQGYLFYLDSMKVMAVK